MDGHVLGFNRILIGRTRPGSDPWADIGRNDHASYWSGSANSGPRVGAFSFERDEATPETNACARSVPMLVRAWGAPRRRRTCSRICSAGGLNDAEADRLS